MKCPQCQSNVIIEPVYKDHLCKNKNCDLYLKGDVFASSNYMLDIIDCNNKINELINQLI